MLASSYPVLDAFLTMLYFFLFIIWIWLLIMVFMDIFRSHDMGGWAKALWVIFIIILPFLGVFVYLIARGGKMHERAAQQAAAAAEGLRPVRQAGRRDARGQHRRPAVQAGRPQVAGRAHRRRVRGPEGQDPGQLGGARVATESSSPVATQEDHEPGDRTASPDRPAGSRPAATTAAAAGSDAMSQRLADRIEQDVESPPPWRSIAKKSVLVVVAGITIYLVFPSLAAVFDSFPKLTSLDPIWFTFALVLQVAHFTCTIALQRIALRTKAWFSVTTSQLSGNAISLIVPGGAAFGAATQFRMLAASGNDPATAVAGLTAFSLLGIGGLLALPIFVLPAILAGTPIADGLRARGAARPRGLRALRRLRRAGAHAGRAAALGRAGSCRRRATGVKRKAAPMTGLPDRLVFERNRIRDVLGRRWKAAMLLSSGRLAFDFGTLLACVRATGVKPNPSLVLLAYAVAGLLALIPITPGGLGIVEAGLSALLILAGVPGGDAVVATLAYRIISYWLPILVGPFAYLAFRLRYGKPGTRTGARDGWADRAGGARPDRGAALAAG